MHNNTQMKIECFYHLSSSQWQSEFLDVIDSLNWNTVWIEVKTESEVNFVILYFFLALTSAVSHRADDWRNKALLVHAQHDGVCDCVLYSVGLRPGAKLH